MAIVQDVFDISDEIATGLATGGSDNWECSSLCGWSQ